MYVTQDVTALQWSNFGHFVEILCRPIFYLKANK